MSGSREFRIDFHVHTSYSFDCATPPKLVLEMARRRGLHGLAITDHDRVEGALAALEANRDPDLLVIPGIEIKSDLGDVIALYVTQNVRSRRFAEVIDEIHALGGLAYLPHPMRTFGEEGSHRIARQHPEIDLWELHNGRYFRSHHEAARRFFDELAIAGPMCGSDAHVPWEVGLYWTRLARLPTDPRILLECAPSATPSAEPRDELAVRVGTTIGETIKSLKRRQYAKTGALLAGLPWRAARKAAQAVRHAASSSRR
ncbi:MAG TPA: PHP domain-containing protein [Candidatus Acidoferrales bacterium]|nr:PHP domain-containing protein [Candidatus Acidoferrales bacterium]